MRHSALANVLVEVVQSGWNAPLLVRPAWADQPRLPHTFYASETTAEDRHTFALTVRLLIEIARHARAIGARPVVLVIPELWQVDLNRYDAGKKLRRAGVRWRRPQQVLRAELGAEGIEVIDALPALSRAQRTGFPRGQQVFYRGWRHLTASGHEVIARLLRARLHRGSSERRLSTASRRASATLSQPGDVK
jgi:hypothetical protein